MTWIQKALPPLYDFQLGSLICFNEDVPKEKHSTPSPCIISQLFTYFLGFISKSLFSATRQISFIITAIQVGRWNVRQHSSVSQQLITIIPVCLPPRKSMKVEYALFNRWHSTSQCPLFSFLSFTILSHLVFLTIFSQLLLSPFNHRLRFGFRSSISFCFLKYFIAEIFSNEWF